MQNFLKMINSEFYISENISKQMKSNSKINIFEGKGWNNL